MAHASTTVVSWGCVSLQWAPKMGEMRGNVNIPPAHSLENEEFRYLDKSSFNSLTH